MVGPGDDRAADGSRLRASDTDREQVIDVLKAAFVTGRIAKDELDLRVGLALRAQTYARLDALTADIPAGLAAAESPGMPVRGPGRVPTVRRRERAIVATSTFTILVWTLALFAGPAAGAAFMAGTLSALTSLFLVGRLMVSARHDPSGPRPSGQRALNTGRGTAYRLGTNNKTPSGPADARFLRAPAVRLQDC